MGVQRSGRAEHEVVLHLIGIGEDDFDELSRLDRQLRRRVLHFIRHDAQLKDDIGRRGDGRQGAPAAPLAPPPATNATCAASSPGCE